MGETLIIGAGPAGMTAAYHLAKAGKKLTMLEQESGVGGLSKTYEFREGNAVFYTDNGPHRFFSKNQQLYDLIEELLDERWIKVKRQTRQFIEGKFYDYPINATQALMNIGAWRAMKILLDYGVARVKYGLFRKRITNFEDYIISRFGRTLGELNMLNYTEKIWGIPCTQIHPDWAGQRIRGLTLTTAAWTAIKQRFKTSTHTPKSLVSAFYYPDKGTGLIYETMRANIEKAGCAVHTNARPLLIKHKQKRITAVEAVINDKSVVFKPDALIESVHITEFVKLLSPPPPPAVLEAVKKLQYRSQVYVFLTLDRKSVTKDQWIYFPDKSVPFARISEMRNFSKKMSPQGKTSLFLEYFCTEGDEIWTMEDKQLYELSLSHLERLGFIKRKEVRRHYIMRKRNVYPVYDLHYQKHLAVIIKYLDSFKNLYVIGRPGRFRYNNQDHSIEMGALAAKSVMEGKKYDIGAVGSENEYYEKGKLK